MRVRMVICCVVAIALTSVGHAFAGDTRYGIVTGSLPAPTADKVTELGTGAVRISISWRDVEPNCKNCRDLKMLEAIDDWAEQARDRGLTVFATLSETPSWATNPPGGDKTQPPGNLQDWYDFVYYIVSRLKTKGVKHWGIWNEPDSPTFLSRSCGLSCYGSLLQRGHDAVKAADPSAYVLGPETTDGAVIKIIPGYFRKIIQNYGHLIDIVTVHFYDTNPQKWKIDRYMEFAHKLAPGKPLWLTEVGKETWDDQKQWDSYFNVLNAYPSRQSWWQKVFFYVLYSKDEPAMAITHYPGYEPRLAFTEYKNWINGDSGTANTVSIEKSVSVYEYQAVAEVKITLTTADGLPIQQDYTVNWSTSAGTADASDFTPQSGTVNFVAGTHVPYSITINIPITSDSVLEEDETFLVTLSNPSPGLEIDNGIAIVTILDDDLPTCVVMGGNYCSQTGSCPPGYDSLGVSSDCNPCCRQGPSCGERGGDYCSQSGVCPQGYNSLGISWDCNPCCQKGPSCGAMGGDYCSHSGVCPPGYNLVGISWDCTPCCKSASSLQSCGEMGGDYCSQTNTCPPGYESLGRSNDCIACCRQGPSCGEIGGDYCSQSGACPGGFDRLGRTWDCNPCCLSQPDPCGGDPCCGDPCCGAPCY